MNNGEHHSQFYGPATSCADLAEVGYTLNGYYLTKSKEQHQPSSGGNIDVVHCRFQQSQQITKGISLKIHCRNYQIYQKKDRPNNINFQMMMITIVTPFIPTK